MHRNQRGVTLLGWVAILAVIGFFALFAMKLVPPYTQVLEVNSTLEAMQTDFNGTNATPQRLRSGITDKFRSKNFAVIGPKDVEIKSVKGGHEIRIAYEHKTMFIESIGLGLYVDVDKKVLIER